MKYRYPIDALLRPPIELYVSAVAFICAAIAWLAPWSIMMTPSIALLATLIFIIVGVLEAFRGFRIIRYHRNLRRLPLYALKRKQIPYSQRYLYLGKGFQWRARHIQRLRDLMEANAERYTDPSVLYQWARRKEVEWENNRVLHQLGRLFCSNSPLNPVRPRPAVGGWHSLHAVEPNEQAVWLSATERMSHMLVLGTTGVGKTRFCEVLVTQDIMRGDTVIVFDPKGDADLLMTCYLSAKQAGREDQFYCFHLGHPDLSDRYNALGRFSRITEVATRMTNSLPTQGNAAAFKEFSWLFVNIVARASVALGRRPDYFLIDLGLNNMDQLFLDYCAYLFPHYSEQWAVEVENHADCLKDKEIPREFQGRSKRLLGCINFIKKHNINDPIIQGLLAAIRFERSYFDKLSTAIKPLLEKLTSGKTAELIAPDYDDLNDERPIFDWMQVLRNNAIVYVGLDALSDNVVSSAVGNSMFSDLTSLAGYIYKHGKEGDMPSTSNKSAKKGEPKVCIHADEFNELIGDEFVPMVNKARGAGFQVTAYTQTWSDIEARVGDRAKAGQIGGNFNSLVLLRVKEYKTAELLTQSLRKVRINKLIQASGATDFPDPDSGTDFSSKNEDQITSDPVPLLEPSDLFELPKGQAFVSIEGGQLWKVRMPLSSSDHREQVPDSINAMVKEMRQSYRSDNKCFIDDLSWVGQ